jgi:hypothetical protein
VHNDAQNPSRWAFILTGGHNGHHLHRPRLLEHDPCFGPCPCDHGPSGGRNTRITALNNNFRACFLCTGAQVVAAKVAATAVAVMVTASPAFAGVILEQPTLKKVSICIVLAVRPSAMPQQQSGAR